MYKCHICDDESEYPSMCCDEEMSCSACQGAGCLLCEDDRKFAE